MRSYTRQVRGRNASAITELHPSTGTPKNDDFQVPTHLQEWDLKMGLKTDVINPQQLLFLFFWKMKTPFSRARVRIPFFYTLPKFNSSPLKSYRAPIGKSLSSNHPFSGASCSTSGVIQGAFIRPAICGVGDTWRIIPFSKWLITMVSKSPK